MADFKRVSYGDVSPFPVNVVRVGSGERDFGDYRELQSGNVANASRRLAARKTIDGRAMLQAAWAILCGRIVAQNPNTPRLFRRCWYCRQRQTCRACYYMGKRHAAKALTADVDGKRHTERYPRCLSMIFTFPKPDNREQSLDYHRRTKACFDVLPTAITDWKRRVQSLNQLGEYVIGIHSKPRADKPFLWPHMHLVATARRHADLQEFTERLARTFRREAGLDGLRVKSLVMRGISVPYLTNQFTYAACSTKRDDTPETIAERDRIFAEAGITRSSTHSRRPGRKKISLPNEFHPVALGCTEAFMFPIDGSEHIQIDVRDYDDQQSQLLAAARQLIRDRFPPVAS